MDSTQNFVSGTLKSQTRYIASLLCESKWWFLTKRSLWSIPSFPSSLLTLHHCYWTPEHEGRSTMSSLVGVWEELRLGTSAACCNECVQCEEQVDGWMDGWTGHFRTASFIFIYHAENSSVADVYWSEWRAEELPLFPPASSVTSCQIFQTFGSKQDRKTCP